MRIAWFVLCHAAFVAVTLAAPASALAQSLSADFPTLVRTADANADGVVTRPEYLARRQIIFANADQNRDGVLQRAEFDRIVAGMPAPANFMGGQIWQTINANGDAALSAAEWQNAPAPSFDRADRNRNGQLDRDEVAAVLR